jgi:hypothetical protein
MKTMKNLILALTLITGMIFFTSCEKDDDFNPIDQIENPIDTVNNPIDTVNNPIDTINNPIDTVNNPVGYVRTYVHEFDFVDISKLQIFKQTDGTVDSIFKFNDVDTTFITPEFGKITAKDGSKTTTFSTIESIENVGDYMKITADFATGLKSAGAMSTVMVEKETGEISTVAETPVTDGEYVVIPNNDWTWVNNAGISVTFTDNATTKTGSVININTAEFINLITANIADFYNTTGYGVSEPFQFACSKTVKDANGNVYGYVTFSPNSTDASNFVTVVQLMTGSSLTLNYVKTSNKAEIHYVNSFTLIVNDNLDLVTYGYTPDMRSLVKGNKIISQINTGTLDSYTWMKGYMYAPSFTIYDKNNNTLNAFANPSNVSGDGYNNQKLTSKMILFGDYIYYVTEESGSNYVTKIQISTINTTSQFNVEKLGTKTINSAIESVFTTENGYFILTSGTTNYFIYEDGHMETKTATDAGDVIEF